MKLISLITPEIIRDCLTDIVRAKMEVDSNNFGGVMFERDLAAALRKSGHIVYTQRQIETLMDSGESFDFGVAYDQFKRNQKDINSDVYASDLFLFDRVNDIFVLVDSLSLKTSINDNDGSSVFIANDAEGVIYDRFVDDITDFNVGKVLIVSLNTDSLQFSVDYFDGQVADVAGLFRQNDVTEERVVFNLKDSVIGGKSRQVIKIVNRNAVTGKKQTSFNRGFTVRRDFIPVLTSLDIFKNIASGTVEFSSANLVEELLVVG